MFIPDASMRLNAWNPDVEHRAITAEDPQLLSFHPIWSQRERTPMAYVGPFSNRELDQGTRYGL